VMKILCGHQSGPQLLYIKKTCAANQTRPV
jgi:hypothetical protein